MFTGSIVWKGIVYAVLMTIAKGLVSTVVYFDYILQVWKKNIFAIRLLSKKKSQQPTPEQQPAVEEAVACPPHSAALLIGFAMIARGEIGFLIASLSQSSGTLTLRHADGTKAKSSGEDVFLVVIWGVVLCTMTGPIGVGILVRRLRQREGGGSSAWL